MSRRCSEWRRVLRDGAAACRILSPVYGYCPRTLAHRRRRWLEVLDRFADQFGDRPVRLCRSPARISLNPHCDHQGAWVPYGTHAREVVAVCGTIPCGPFEITNVDPACQPLLRFRVDEEIAVAPGAWEQGWFTYIEHPAVVERRLQSLDVKGQRRSRTGAINYVRAAALRLRAAYPGLSNIGLQMALSGDITQASGQSSSSALVVMTACALLAAAGRRPGRRSLARLCGEAEWYVGTRGGSGDHAAMLLGRRAGLTHICFAPPFDIRAVRPSPFPEDCQLILVNSRHRSEKSAEERLLFNRGVFAYRFAFRALKDALERYAPELGIGPAVGAAIQCLGDFHTGRLPAAVIYRLLRLVPQAATPYELQARWPDVFAAAARSCFGTVDPAVLPSEIPLRGAALYGLGRVDRGRVMPRLLARGDKAAMDEFGRLMSITHDGDRLITHADGRASAYMGGVERLTDEWMARLAAACAHGGRSQAALRYQPGSYGASTPELDQIVDIVRRVDGVLGAGLMGAGGGGFVLVLAWEGEPVLAAVRIALERDYYRPLGKEPEVERWQPTAPAGELLLSASG
ncbi:MAG: hypothetical protein HY320_06250 [Armatimonadetes bacterium]|nr:hypothetical protein [Armatimonadota bacterium]